MIRGSMILILSYKAIIKETMPAHFKYGSMTTPIIVTCWSEWQKTNKGYDCVLWRGCGGTVRRLHVFLVATATRRDTQESHRELPRSTPWVLPSNKHAATPPDRAAGLLERGQCAARPASSNRKCVARPATSTTIALWYTGEPGAPGRFIPPAIVQGIYFSKLYFIFKAYIGYTLGFLRKGGF